MLLNIYEKNLLNQLKYNIPVDIIEHNDSFEINADLPGFSKDDISIDFKDNTLTISSSSVNSSSYNTAKVWRKERSLAKKERSFIFDDNIDVDNINANFENGVLKINIPKKEHSSLIKKISIS